MPEYFERYRKFERLQSNKMIDKPILLLCQMTWMELVSGLSLVVASFYVAFASKLAALVVAIVGFCLPIYLRKLRQVMPRGTLLHFLWNLGLMDKELPRAARRTKKTVMGP
jgi:hypothetical protein